MRSWDCFDTLIGRYFFEPKSIFDIVSKKIHDPSFTHKRIIAEKKSKSKTYEDIYKRLPGYDPSIELQTELEYSFPIKSNFNQIQDGDIIVSDMYLSSIQIEKILRHHGLTKDVKVYSSYGGKRHGWIWNDIKKQHNIEYHIGDNIDSDVKSARKNNINSIFFPGRMFTETELLIQKYSLDLSYLVRMLRLLNPYKENKFQWIHSIGSFINLCGNEWIEEINGGINRFKIVEQNPDFITIQRHENTFVKLFCNHSLLSLNNQTEYNFLYNGFWLDYNDSFNNREDQKKLWNDQTQYNIPVLINISKLLPKNIKLSFCYRDCLYLKNIYDSIFNTVSNIIDVSRHSYYHPFNQEYVDYIINATDNTIIVDSHGSGKSCSSFFNRVNLKRNLIHICWHEPKKNKKYKKIFYDTFIKCKKGEHFSCKGRAFEKFNIPYMGVLIDFKDGRAIRSSSEHDKIICDVQSDSIAECIKYIRYYSDNIIPNKIIIDTLLDLMKYSYTSMAVNSITK